MNPNNPKLVHLVRKYWLRGENDEKILESLLMHHREYQRKDIDRLHQTVILVVEKLTSDDKYESDYDREANDHDKKQSGSGGLNASLCNNYRKRTEKQQPADSPIAVDAAPQQEEDEEKKTEETTPNRKKKRRKVKRSILPDMTTDAPSLAPSAASFLVKERPKERYADLGGMTETIDTLQQLVEYPIRHPHLYTLLNVEPPRGILFKGPPGTGKSHLANAVAGELNVPYYRISAPELVSGVSGESEGRIRELFQVASSNAPCLVFIDEIDVIAPKRNDEARGMEKRMVAQFLTCLDSIVSTVIVICATNRPDALDTAFRRRFDKELDIGVPDQQARCHMIKAMTAPLRTSLQDPEDILVLAKATPGYVGADLKSLIKQAAAVAIHRILQKDEGTGKITATTSDSAAATAAVEETPPPVHTYKDDNLAVTMEDFLQALPLVQPSAKREGFATVPDVSFDDIGALAAIRAELEISVLEPIRAPERFQRLGLTLPAGVLLYGPPGCGKTLLAKAIAKEAAANFISVKGPELLDKYVGESERAVRLVFDRARSSSPCIVFFDELDSLVPRRGAGGDGSRVTERVVNQLLTELDGLESRKSVFVIAATNRPELIDPAMLRPGRLDKLLYVPLPTAPERVLILKKLTTTVALGETVDLQQIGSSVKADGYSGADCAALVREAGLAVLKEDISSSQQLCIEACHFEKAFLSVMPSVSKKDQARYEKIRDRMASARSRTIINEDPPPE